MLCQWDDVPWAAHEHGDIRAERRRLGGAAGARDIGLSRYRIAPGAQAMPLHVHADEEEILFVLAGSGFSWQDDALHEVRAGDVIVHRPSAEAHTLIAADDEPLDVLAFGSGSPTGLTQLPRAGVTWVGSRWLPAGAPRPRDAAPLPLRRGGAVRRARGRRRRAARRRGAPPCAPARSSRGRRRRVSPTHSAPATAA